MIDHTDLPLYLRIADKAKHFRELGMSDRAIARALGVSDKTVAKAAAAAGALAAGCGGDEVRVRVREARVSDEAGIVGVSELRPGLVDQLPDEPGCVKRHVVRVWVIGAGWWRLTRAGESGKERVVVTGLWVGRWFPDRVPAWEEAPIIHPVARGGPECRAVLAGSINLTAVLIDVEKEARHRSELARARTSRPRERKCGVSWRGSCGLGQLVVVVVVDGLVFEAADLAVAQPVVAEGEDLASDRDLRDVAPAAFGDPLERDDNRFASEPSRPLALRSAILQ